MEDDRWMIFSVRYDRNGKPWRFKVTGGINGEGPAYTVGVIEGRERADEICNAHNKSIDAESSPRAEGTPEPSEKGIEEAMCFINGLDGGYERGTLLAFARILRDALLASRHPESAEPTTSARELAEKLFEGVALRVDQFFKAKNIQGGVRSGDDLFSPMDKHELAKTIERYAQARAALAPREDKP